MRKLSLVCALLPVLALLAGCPKKKDGETDAGDAAVEEAAAAASADAAAPGPAAKNVADVARFPAETTVEDDEAKLASVGTARTAPKGGNIVAQIKPGTDVDKIAEFQDCILVGFVDPKDPNAKLMGWIEKSAFTFRAIRDAGPKDAGKDAAPADAGKPALTCAAGQVAVVLTKDPVCKKKCAKDADCKGGAAGACATAAGVGGKAVRVCTAE
jgi:hypothetical protein